jgi:hypothetical protein
MKRLAIPFLAFVFIFGMSSMATAQLSDGTYDFYGTFSIDMHDADGAGQACSLAVNGLSCPSTTNMCIKNLVVSGGGTQISSGDPSPYYGIGIGQMVGTLMTIDPDGGRPVNLTVGSSSADDILTNIDVGEAGGSCAAAAACVNSYSTGFVAPGGGTGTVTGDMGIFDASKPTTYPLCAGGNGTYGLIDFTTETAEARASNENGANQSISQTGSRLSGSSLVLKQPEAAMRFQAGPIVVGTDIIGINTVSGTFCQPAGSCIPNEAIYCPAEND